MFYIRVYQTGQGGQILQKFRGHEQQRSHRGAMRSLNKSHIRYSGVDDEEQKKVIGVLMAIFEKPRWALVFFYFFKGGPFK